MRCSFASPKGYRTYTEGIFTLYTYYATILTPMNRRNKTIEYRNRQMYADYIVHLRNGLPSMLAYATIANQYDPSENHVRNIIMNTAHNH